MGSNAKGHDDDNYQKGYFPFHYLTPPKILYIYLLLTYLNIAIMEQVAKKQDVMA
jgi:hypothetical protein